MLSTATTGLTGASLAEVVGTAGLQPRTCTDSGESLFEFKTKGRRGQPVEHRMPCEAAGRRHLLLVARDFLDRVPAADYGITVPDLVPGGGPVDDDRPLRGPDLVVVESKIAGGKARADPQHSASSWNQLLRRHFGRRREAHPQHRGRFRWSCNRRPSHAGRSA